MQHLDEIVRIKHRIAYRPVGHVHGLGELRGEGQLQPLVRAQLGRLVPRGDLKPPVPALDAHEIAELGNAVGHLHGVIRKLRVAGHLTGGEIEAFELEHRIELVKRPHMGEARKLPRFVELRGDRHVDPHMRMGPHRRLPACQDRSGDQPGKGPYPRRAAFEDQSHRQLDNCYNITFYGTSPKAARTVMRR